MAEDPLSTAIRLLDTGRAEEARQILLSLVQESPERESAWIWLAETFPEVPQRIQVLEQYLKINPQSGVALAALAKLQNRVTGGQDADDSPGAEEEPVPVEKPAPRAAARPARPAEPPESELEPEEAQAESLRSTVNAFREPAGEGTEAPARPRYTSRRRRRRNYWPAILILLLLVIAIPAGIWLWYTFGPGALPAVGTLPTATAEPTPVPAPTETPLPPTATAEPTVVPLPTETPLPPTSTPDPSLPVPVYFLRGDAASAQIWRLETDGRSLTRITTGSDPVTGFDVHPRDGRLAYVTNNRLVLADPDGAIIQTLVVGDPDPGNNDNWSRTERISDPRWAPDGGRLAYGQNGINIYVLATGQSIPLVRNEVPQAGQIRLYLPKLWTRDSTRVIARIALAEASSLAVVPSNGAPVIRAAPVEGVRLPCCDIAVSRDGRTALIAGATSGFQDIGLFRMDLVSGAVATLFKSEPGGLFTHFSGPAQALDGSWLYFFSVSSDGNPGFMQLHQAGTDGISDFNSLREDGQPAGETIWSPDADLTLRLTDGGLVLVRTDGSPGVTFPLEGVITNLRWGVWPDR